MYILLIVWVLLNVPYINVHVPPYLNALQKNSASLYMLIVNQN